MEKEAMLEIATDKHVYKLFVEVPCRVWFPPHNENYVTTTGVKNLTRLRAI